MRSFLVAVISLAIGGPAFAAERAPSQECVTLDKLKAAIKGAKFTPLNVGQFHFIEGVYAGVPPLSGLPAADGAVLVQFKGKSMVVWMKGTPGCASNEPLAIPEPFVAVIKSINPGRGETSDGYSDDSKD